MFDWLSDNLDSIYLSIDFHLAAAFLVAFFVYKVLSW
jgi:hypothetical protein